MQILILGGTGAMGVSLVKILQEQRENEIFVTSRKNHDDEENVFYLKGNAQDDAWISKILALKSWDVVVDFMIYTTEHFRKRLPMLLNSAGQYIFFSSSRVYADAHGEKITEEKPRLLDTTKDQIYLKTDEYALAKAREENILQSAEQRNWTIIRPYITYNDERLQIGNMVKESWLYRALHGRTVVFTKDMAETLTTMTYGYDVAKGITSIIGKDEALGEIFHITQPNPITWGQVASIYQKVFKKVTNRDMKIKYLSDSQKFSKAFSNHWQVYCDRLYARTFDNSKISYFLGEDYQWVSMEDGLTNCLVRFMEGKRKFLTINWEAEGWMDKQTGERTLLSEIPSVSQRIVYIFTRYLPYGIAAFLLRCLRGVKRTMKP